MALTLAKSRSLARSQKACCCAIGKLLAAAGAGVGGAGGAAGTAEGAAGTAGAAGAAGAGSAAAGAVAGAAAGSSEAPDADPAAALAFLAFGGGAAAAAASRAARMASWSSGLRLSKPTTDSTEPSFSVTFSKIFLVMQLRHLYCTEVKLPAPSTATPNLTPSLGIFSLHLPLHDARLVGA